MAKLTKLTKSTKRTPKIKLKARDPLDEQIIMSERLEENINSLRHSINNFDLSVRMITLYLDKYQANPLPQIMLSVLASMGILTTMMKDYLHEVPLEQLSPSPQVPINAKKRTMRKKK